MGAALLLIIVLAEVVYPILAAYDSNRFEPEIIRAAKNATGRELTLGGDIKLDDFARSRQSRRYSKKLQMQGARILRNEAYKEVRCSEDR